MTGSRWGARDGRQYVGGHFCNYAWFRIKLSKHISFNFRLTPMSYRIDRILVNYRGWRKGDATHDGLLFECRAYAGECAFYAYCMHSLAQVPLSFECVLDPLACFTQWRCAMNFLFACLGKTGKLYKLLVCCPRAPFTRCQHSLPLLAIAPRSKFNTQFFLFFSLNLLFFSLLLLCHCLLLSVFLSPVACQRYLYSGYIFCISLNGFSLLDLGIGRECNEVYHHQCICQREDAA